MKKGIRSHILAAFCLVILAGNFVFACESDDAYLIKGAKIFTCGTQGVLTNAALLIEKGQIKKIIQGELVPPIPVRDYTGKIIMPGMVDAHSYISAYYRLLENTEAITSDLISEAVFDPSNPEVRNALASGITTVNLVPRNENLVGGISSVLKLTQDFDAISVLKKRAFLKISFNGEVIRPDRAPTSLMGAKKWLSQKMRSIESGTDKEREGIFQQEGLRSMLRGDLLPMIAASSLAEINTALQWLEDWDLKGVIVGGEEASLLSDLLKEKNDSVLLSPILFSYPDKWAKNAALLMDRGLAIGFVSHMPESGPLSLRLSALRLTQQGISQEEALKTVTSFPARILGVSDSVGSIEEGKHADFVILDGDPLDLRSRVIAVYVDGNPVFERKE
jgi:imidazolonepropionase-like amidohydrolase